MAAIDPDPQLLLAALLRIVRRNFPAAGAQIDWLSRLQQQAMIGSSTGIDSVLTTMQDHSASAVTSEGSTTQWLRELSAPTIATLCEAALKTIEGDAASGGAGLSISGDSRGFDFSCRPCVMG